MPSAERPPPPKPDNPKAYAAVILADISERYRLTEPVAKALISHLRWLLRG